MKACLTSRRAGPQPPQGSGECQQSPWPVHPPSWLLQSETGAQPHLARARAQPAPNRAPGAGPQVQGRMASGWPGRQGHRLWARGRHDSVTGAPLCAGILPGFLSLILGRGASCARRMLSSAHGCQEQPPLRQPLVSPGALGPAGRMCGGPWERGSREGPAWRAPGLCWRSAHGNVLPGHTAFWLDASGRPRLVGRRAPTQHPHLLPGSWLAAPPAAPFSSVRLSWRKKGLGQGPRAWTCALGGLG